MYQYRHILTGRRQGDSDRDITRSKILGRKNIAKVRVGDHTLMACTQYRAAEPRNAGRAESQGSAANHMHLLARPLARADRQLPR